MKNPKPLERATEAKVVAEALRLGIMVRKMNGMGQRGWPDRMFCIPGGRPLFIEFKREGRTLDPLQEIICRRLRKEGYSVEVADTTSDGIRYLHAAMEAAQVPGKSSEAPARTQRGGFVLGPRSGQDIDNAGRVQGSTKRRRR